MDRTSTKKRRTALSRRELLKRTGTAMPAVLTLHSGAALARSSNMISGSNSVDIDGNYRCLDTQYLTPVGETPNHFDFGDPPAVADVTVIPDRFYYTAPDPANQAKAVGKGTGAITPNNSWKKFTGGRAQVQKVLDSERISVAEMCEQGGTFYYEQGGVWQTMEVPRGMLVSSTALSSFAENTRFNLEL
jgi:hypothetical protein